MKTFKQFLTEKTFKIHVQDQWNPKSKESWVSIGSNNLKTAIKELQKFGLNKNRQYKVLHDTKKDIFYVWEGYMLIHQSIGNYFKIHLRDFNDAMVYDDEVFFRDKRIIDFYKTNKFFNGYEVS